jgi:hypothetical protein
MATGVEPGELVEHEPGVGGTDERLLVRAVRRDGLGDLDPASGELHLPGVMGVIDARDEEAVTGQLLGHAGQRGAVHPLARRDPG